MPQPKVVETAQYRPGGDLLTGDSRGPFLDTGMRLGSGKARKGDHVYLSLKHLAPALREVGWLTTKDAEQLRERNAELEQENERLREKEEQLDQLLESILPHIERETVEVEVTREVPRDPTDDEVAAYIQANRSALIAGLDRASDAAYRATYAGHGYLGGERAPSRPPAGVASEPESPGTPTEPVNKLDPGDSSVPSNQERDDAKPDNPISTFELQGNIVNLDEVLAGNVKEVIQFAEGHPEEFQEALVIREYELGELKGAPYPRKGVIEGLGYEFEADDDSDDTTEKE